MKQIIVVYKMSFYCSVKYHGKEKKHTGRSLEYTLKLGNVDAKVTYRGKLF